MTQRMVLSVVLWLLYGFRVFAAETNALSSVRIYGIQPACFEYMFTSVMDGAADKRTLAFNHITGRTLFAGVGGDVGDYKVVAYEPGVERVYNPSVNSYVEKKTGSVKLRGSDGVVVTLELGRIVSQPGYVACIVWPAGGNWMHVGKDDVFPCGDSLASEADRGALAQTWAQRKKQHEESVRRAAATESSTGEPASGPAPENRVIVYDPEAEPPLDFGPSGRVEVSNMPRTFYGSEYVYPISYEEVPLITRGPSGGPVRQPMAVPGRFQAGYAEYGSNPTNRWPRAGFRR